MLFARIESNDEKDDDMDDVFLELEQIEDITMSTESSKKKTLVEDGEEISSHLAY